MGNKPYQNYIFDLYGTLVDIRTEERSPGLWRQVSQYLSMEGVNNTPAQLRFAYEDGVARREEKERVERGENAEIEILPVFRDIYLQQGMVPREEDVSRLARVFRLLSLRKLRLFPGVKSLLKELREEGCGVYLLSNAQSAFTRPELQMLGLMPYFHGILLSSDGGYKKPSPLIFQRLLEEYGIDPKTAVMVGNDDIADCHGAAQVGLDSYYVCTEQSPGRKIALPENCCALKTIAQLKML